MLSLKYRTVKVNDSSKQCITVYTLYTVTACKCAWSEGATGRQGNRVINDRQ